MTGKLWWELEAAAHTPSTLKKQGVVFNSLSHFYPIWGFSPRCGATHTQGRFALFRSNLYSSTFTGCFHGDSQSQIDNED